MIQASRALSAAPLTAALVRRDRPPLFAPLAPASPVETETSDRRASLWRGWREDLRFFAACYAGGLVFFLVMLS